MSTELQDEFKLKFDGELNEVDAATLGYSLLNVTTLVQEVNQEVGAGRKIEIKVRAHQPGSFLVHLGLVTETTPLMDYLTPENLKVAGAALGGVITVVTGLFKLRKVLKGEPPKELVQRGDHVRIEAGDGAVVIVDKSTYNAYFNNPKVNDALSKTFKTLDNDPHITGFEITDRNEVPMFEAKREEFRPMALTSSVPQAQTRAIRLDASLYIVKPSFERNLKWDVVYQGNRIAVTMSDESFLSRIDRGERFAKGDTLEVELQIDQVLDLNINTYINKGYQVVRVFNHVPRAEQPSFNFTEEPPLNTLDAGRMAEIRKEIIDELSRKRLGPSGEQPKPSDKPTDES